MNKQAALLLSERERERDKGEGGGGEQTQWYPGYHQSNFIAYHINNIEGYN